MFALRKFRLEFVLSSRGMSEDMLRRAIEGIGEEIEIAFCPDSEVNGEVKFHVYLNTDDPELVFDICSQYGKLMSVKIDESSGN